MGKPPRPGLDALPFATKKPAAAPVPEPIEVVTSTPETVKGKADDRVTIILRVSAEDRRALKMLFARDGVTVQDMLSEAVQDIIRRSK